MNIAIIGANGRTGNRVVEEALARGHHVRAGVHGVDNLTQAPELEVVQCDATSKNDVTTLISGCDAVISVIGHVKNSGPSMQTTAISVVIESMHQAGIRRLVSLTGTGVRWQGDKPSLLDIVLNKAVLLVDPARIRDGIAHATVIENSDLDWTIVRVLKLTNGKKRQAQPSDYGPASLFVSRATVAGAIVDVLEQGSYIRKLPVL
ncbi:TPA: hypothetical protein DIV49_01320 [Candidatus Saccharibacteria bacterium]|nr:hypothetical protein [Candidatus Saccharibacteria bacterium]HRJ90907.1 NAD(P)H-binding protein [Candidatus Saccharibacteria bacterium]